MAANDVYEVIVKGVCAGQTIMNVLHFIDVIGTGDLQDWVTHWEDTGVSPPHEEYSECLCDDYTPVEYLITKVKPAPRGPQFSVPADVTNVGERLGALHLPTSAVIKWTTAVGGRSGRGRSYIGPLGNQNSSDGMLDGVYTAFITDFANRMLEVFSAAGALYDGHWLFAVYSRLLDVANAVTGASVRTQLKTQRRRQLGVGM